MNREKRKARRCDLFFLLLLTCVLSAQPRQSQSPTRRPKYPRTALSRCGLVLATATVTDRNGRFVTGLEKENFKILPKTKSRRTSTYFSSEDIPLSVGIILDVSGSMKDKLKTAVEAAITFMKGGSPDDEYFLVEFSDKPTGTADFTNDIAKIQSRFMFSKAKGRTALYDAVYMGLSKARRRKQCKARPAADHRR